MSSILYRNYNDDDVSFILDSYLRNLQKTSPNNFINKHIFFQTYKDKTPNLIKNTKTLIACNPENIQQIYSYLIYEQIQSITIIHYIYTKHIYRNLHVATKLLEQINPQEILITNLPVDSKKHLNVSVKHFLNKYNLSYDPSLLDRRYSK